MENQLLNVPTDALRDLIDHERERHRAFGTLAEACRAELDRRDAFGVATAQRSPDAAGARCAVKNPLYCERCNKACGYLKSGLCEACRGVVCTVCDDEGCEYCPSTRASL